MISRILVPIDARPTAALDAPTQRRRPTTMDERTLMPAMLPIVPLNGHSTIPTNLPLESIAARVVVPRDVNREAYGVTEDHSTPVQPTDMDSRIVLPAGAAPGSSSPVFLRSGFTFSCLSRCCSNRSYFQRTSRPKRNWSWRKGK